MAWPVDAARWENQSTKYDRNRLRMPICRLRLEGKHARSTGHAGLSLPVAATPNCRRGRGLRWLFDTRKNVVLYCDSDSERRAKQVFPFAGVSAGTR